MPFLVVGAVTVGVQAPGGVRHEIEEAGERVRAFDYTMRSGVRSRKNRWQVSATLLTRTDADALVAALNATPPVACSGDLLGGPVNCHPQYHGMQPEPAGGGVTRFRVAFTLHEA